MKAIKMTNIKALLPICALFMVSCDNHNSSGTYSGSCTNLTAGINAPITISIQEHEGGAIKGYLSIKGEDLTGDGEITGTIAGKTISFSTPGDESIKGILWTGQVSGDSISGEYHVKSTEAMILLGAPASQEGTWQVRKQ